MVLYTIMTSGVESNLYIPNRYELLAATTPEARSITYVAMEPQQAYTVTPLHERVMSLQSNQPGWELRKNAPHEYCADFKALGLARTSNVTVAVKGIERSALAYTLTDEAREQMLPFLGHLLSISLREEQSLLEIFGSSYNSAQEDAPRPFQTRLAILGRVAAANGEAQPILDITGEASARQGYHHSGVYDLAAAELLTLEENGQRRHQKMVRATDQQLHTIRSVLAAIDGFYNASEAYQTEGSRMAEDIISEKQSVDRLMRKAKLSTAAYKKSLSAPDVMATLSSCVLESETPLTRQAIQPLLESRHVALDISTTNKYLGELVRRGKLVAHSAGHAHTLYSAVT